MNNGFEPSDGKASGRRQNQNQVSDPTKADTYVPDILAITRSSYDRDPPPVNINNRPDPKAHMFNDRVRFPVTTIDNHQTRTTNHTIRPNIPSFAGISRPPPPGHIHSNAANVRPIQTAIRSNILFDPNNARDFVEYPPRRPRSSRQPNTTPVNIQNQVPPLNSASARRHDGIIDQERANIQSFLQAGQQLQLQPHNQALLQRLIRVTNNSQAHNHQNSVAPFQNQPQSFLAPQPQQAHQQPQSLLAPPQQQAHVQPIPPQQFSEMQNIINNLLLNQNNGLNNADIQSLLTSPAYNESFLENLIQISNSQNDNNLPNQHLVPFPRIDPRQKERQTEEDIALQDKFVEAQNDEFQQAETYADYKPSKLAIGQRHPDPVVETSSLATVMPPDITYQLKLPQKIIDEGLLSALQLETVVYASQQHERMLPDLKTRAGFLVGDGAGVGKGRTIAGIIYENYLHGRKKSIWLSVSTDLKLDAERDLKDIGAKIPVYTLNKFAYGKRLDSESKARQGFVLFSTYKGLIAETASVRGPLGSRIGQIVEWVGENFDGLIVFDECHKAKSVNALGKGKPSKTASYTLEIQNRLPNARVVYASATGASETANMGYMTRLGIWGVGTPYATFPEFCKSVEKRGVGAMELVAIDLKMRGAYIARQLSFKGTSFNIEKVELSEEYKKVYNDSVDLWTDAKEKFKRALLLFHDDKKLYSRVWIQFWSAHQRYFKYLCIGAKVPFVVKTSKEALDKGKCVVIGLQSTGEAKTKEAFEEAGELTDFISTARAVFETLIENYFPAPERSRKSTPPLGNDLNFDRLLQDDSNSNDIRFIVENGLATAKLSNFDPKASKLLELVAKKTRIVSDRTLRLKRRAAINAQQRSRIAMGIEPDSDTEITTSNPSSSSSSVRIEDESGESDDIGSDITCTSDSNVSGTETDESDLAWGKRKKKWTDNRTIRLESKKQGKKTSKISPIKKRLIVSDSEESSDTITDAKIQKKEGVVQNRVIDYVDLCDDDDDDEEETTLSKPAEQDVLVVNGPILTEMKESLLEKLKSLAPNLPSNTLDDLINQLGGPSKVAEMTGRKGRVVASDDGTVSYETRNEADITLELLNVAEKARFMDDEKRVAIISEAASSGISLHADRRAKNQCRRVHITIELPWSADRAIQQFGRSHRSNQTSAPEYMFLISDLAGEQRFASIVAKRLESLGALTHGDRRATTESRDLSQFNIMTKYGTEALNIVLKTIVGDTDNRYADLPDYIEGQDFLKDAKKALVGCGLATTGRNFYGQTVLEKDSNNVTKFLNRLLGMKVEIQNAVFQYFMDTMDYIIARAKRLGNFDSGIMELSSDTGKVKCGQPDRYMLSCLSGKVRCELLSVLVERGLSWPEISQKLKDNKKHPEEGFYIIQNEVVKSTFVILALLEPSSLSEKRYRIYKPNQGLLPKCEPAHYFKERGKLVEPDQAKELWSSIYEKTDTHCVHECFYNKCARVNAGMICEVGLRHRKYCILSGGILTAWPYLERKSPEVTSKLIIVRLKTSDGMKLIGPIIPLNLVDSVKKLLLEGQEQGVNF